MTKWPPVDFGNIFSYILLRKEFNSEYVGKYKDQKAFSYWKSNFVDTIHYSENQDGKCVLSCNVTPSQQVRDEPRNVWVALKNDGAVLCGWCTCIAGTSETCNHMIAMLYKVEYAVTHGFTNPASTSVPWGWNVSTRRDIEPGKIIDMHVRKDKRSNDRAEDKGIITEGWKEFDPRRGGHREVTAEERNTFLAGYRNIRPTAQLFRSTESEEHDRPAKPLDIVRCAEKYVASQGGSQNEQEIISRFLEIIPLNERDVSKIERTTRNQSKSNTWKEQRKGRITASNFKSVSAKVDSVARAKGTLKSKTTALVSRLLHGSPNIDYIPAIKWGKEKEDQAYNEFHVKALAQHQQCKLSKSGLWVMKNKPYIGASRDGVMSCACCGNAVLEIKCPYSIRNSCVSDNWHQTDFLTETDGVVKLKTDHSYYYQITGQMAITGSSRCFFVVWTTQELHVEIVHFDAVFWGSVLQKLDVFFKSYMVKVLLGIQTIYFCPTCEKVILEGHEIPEGSDEKNCVLWCVWSMVPFQMHTDL